MPGKHPGNTQETPGKHPGKVHLLTFRIKEACFRIKTSLAKVVGIFSKSKSVQKKCSGIPKKHPGNTRASLEKNFFGKSCGDFLQSKEKKIVPGNTR